LTALVATRNLTFNADAKPQRTNEPFEAEFIARREDILRRPAVEYAVFDHDGTISLLREGWEDVMESCMIEAVTGGKPCDADTMESIRSDCREFIVRSTGIQTINQMVMLVDIVRGRGLVPEQYILTPQQYKEIYNDRLLAHIADRKKKIEKGLLTPADVTVGGSIDFVRTLAENGVTIYLASGTDQDDVRKEARLLGYADYFTGGIFGSVGDVNNDPKQKVLRGILSSRGVDMQKLAIFGDGPVEMREARSNGALGVGVLSNEIRRYGWNISKHKRLFQAGADMLIPDFLEHATLASFLLKKD
jgi:phosphoglycolate phosphatase-like HAD superfamily hydrolase